MWKQTKFLVASCVLYANSSYALASAATIKKSSTACHSIEAYNALSRILSRRDRIAYENAFLTGECIRLRYGQRVQKMRDARSFFLEAFRLPGRSKIWWTHHSSFMSALEFETFISKLEQDERKIKRANRTGASRRPPLPRKKQLDATLPSWRPLRLARPAAKSKKISSASALFARARLNVWAVSAVSTGKSTIGSAVAISPRLLLTNCHVVRRATRLRLIRDAVSREARVVAGHASSDKCIIRSDALLGTYVTGVRRYDDLKVGERVFTVGSPRGLQHTLGDGLISGLRIIKIGRVVQTSAPISPGSSGGGLFDEVGNLVGITTFLLKDSQSLNFAIAAEEYWK